MKRNRISAIGIVIFWFVGSAQAAPTQLTLVKEVVGGDATTNDWTLTADGTADNDLSGSGWISGLVAPDTFALSESSGPSSYEAGTWECVGGGSFVGSDLTLSEGENVTCTIINTFVPPVVIFNSDFALPLMPVGDGAGTPVCIDETGLLVEGCDGAVGPEGPQGPTGPEGPQGPEGPPGPDSSTEIKVELCNLFIATVTPPPPLCFNCGNGVNEPLEQCDDGNVADGDGCSSICENEEICDGSNLGLTIGCAAYYEDYSCDGAMQCMTYGWGPCEMPEDVCDYLDNDCNGVVDDSFIIAGLYVDDQHCGGCNNSCIDRFPNATGYCEVQGQAAQCGFTCNVGFVDLNLGAADGCECEITSEICDGLDNDCDGFTDEGC